VPVANLYGAVLKRLVPGFFPRGRWNFPKLQNTITQNATFVGANRYVRWRIPLRLLAAHATFAGA